MIESNFNSLYPIIISIPHSGTNYSKSFLNSTKLSINELKFSEDSYIDELLSNILLLILSKFIDLLIILE